MSKSHISDDLDYSNNSNYENETLGVSGWKLAAVNAAGALGGAGSVVVICSWLSFTPAVSYSIQQKKGI